MKERLQHGVYHVSEDAQNLPWSCDLVEGCREKAKFIIVEVFEEDESVVQDHRGACPQHADEWAQNDNCQSCLNKIRKYQ